MDVPYHTSTHSEDVIEVYETIASSHEPVEFVESSPDMDANFPKSLLVLCFYFSRRDIKSVQAPKMPIFSGNETLGQLIYLF